MNYKQMIREAAKRDKWNSAIDEIQESCHVIGGAVVLISGLFAAMYAVGLIIGLSGALVPFFISGAANAFGWLMLAM